MSPRVAYWTSAFEPDIEAVAFEVDLLRRQFRASVSWGLSPRYWALLSWRRGYYCLNPRLHLVFRLITRLLEPVFHLNHIFGSPGDWFYLVGNRRRPTILTAAVMTPPVARPLLERIDRFVVEYPGGREELERMGIERARIRLIFPPVNLQRFTPAPAPEGPFTVLFASSPDAAAWLEARGIPQLLDAAALRPQMRFRLLWRRWGDSLPRVQHWLAQRGLTNVEVVVGRCADMATQYQAAHVTVAPFTQLDRCKPMPNSLVESLACGRPVVTTPEVGLADMVREEQAGRVCVADGAALADSFDELQADWSSFAQRARQLAERWFASENFVPSYHRLYQELVRV
jgi:glycosyltransferase involved in cell wall biosynthesis